MKRASIILRASASESPLCSKIHSSPFPHRPPFTKRKKVARRKPTPKVACYPIQSLGRSYPFCSSCFYNILWLTRRGVARSMDIKDVPGASRSRSRSPEAAARQPPTMRVTRSCSRVRVFSIPKEELHLNYWFRNGPGHNFEDGVQYVESWQGKAEEEVLLDRAARKVKPVACVVLNNYGEKDQRRILRLCKEHRLHYHSIRNEWGIDVLYATATPSTTLGTLLAGRADCQAQGLTLEDAVSRRHIQWYFTRGFDLASNPSMGVLESALLYGYPTELHGKEDIWNEFESIWQLKL